MHLREGTNPMAHGLQVIYGRKGKMKGKVILGDDTGKVNYVSLIFEDCKCQAE